jgi:aspartyl aminopeptidase
MKMDDVKVAEDLLKFIDFSVSPFHAVKASEDILKKAGFSELLTTKEWQLKPGGKYFTQVYGSTLIAFTVGENPRARLRIAAAHTDFPCLRIKPAASLAENGYGKLNVEVYGGMILNTWLDRPLSVAGKVVLAGKDAFSPKTKYIDIKRPLLTIPNLAIHMNRKVNEGVELNRQKDMLPLATMLPKELKDTDFFADLLAKELACEKEEILSYELTVYPTENGCVFGFDEEFISSPRLDNLTAVKGCLDGLLEGKCPDGINIIALFDNEEVGSRTKQGAGSLVLPQIIERIYETLGYSRQAYFADIAGGFMLSVDVAHAMHPNMPEKNDITNKPILNGGVALKVAASQSYAGDAEAVAVIRGLCQEAELSYQYFVNRSDITGGSTLGSIASSLLPMRTMDIGIPILAMHSARETMGLKDQATLKKLLCVFFS